MTVTVFGEHFTPFDKVHIDWSFDAPDFFGGEEDAATDKDGEIVGDVQFNVKSSDATAITAKATDRATGLQVLQDQVERS